ncbi:MAG: 50S ribosomal protein L5 [Fimbriimonadales bacterium]
MTPRLRTHYEQVVRGQLQQQFGYRNPMQIPKLEKIVINMGVGKGEQEPKTLENAVRDLALITGQKPVVTTAKKSIANFRLREGHRIGCKVTLRGDRMYVFLEKLINLVLPRIRDFSGISSRSFDGRGNYSLGLKEQILFPEIVYDQVDRIRGMDITFCTTAKTDEEAFALLKALGLPFRK